MATIMMLAMASTAFATTNEVHYAYPTGTSSFNDLTETAEKITSDTTTLNSTGGTGGWYYVDGAVAIDGQLTVDTSDGGVNVIFLNNSSLTVTNDSGHAIENTSTTPTYAFRTYQQYVADSDYGTGTSTFTVESKSGSGIHAPYSYVSLNGGVINATGTDSGIEAFVFTTKVCTVNAYGEVRCIGTDGDSYNNSLSLGANFYLYYGSIINVTYTGSNLPLETYRIDGVNTTGTEVNFIIADDLAEEDFLDKTVLYGGSSLFSWEESVAQVRGGDDDIYNSLYALVKVDGDSDYYKIAKQVATVTVNGIVTGYAYVSDAVYAL